VPRQRRRRGLGRQWRVRRGGRGGRHGRCLRAVGVDLVAEVAGPAARPRTLRACRVFICAPGPFGTCHLLLLSGVDRPVALRAVGVTRALHLPVGEGAVLHLQLTLTGTCSGVRLAPVNNASLLSLSAALDARTSRRGGVLGAAIVSAVGRVTAGRGAYLIDFFDTLMGPPGDPDYTAEAPPTAGAAVDASLVRAMAGACFHFFGGLTVGRVLDARLHCASRARTPRTLSSRRRFRPCPAQRARGVNCENCDIKRTTFFHAAPACRLAEHAEGALARRYGGRAAPHEFGWYPTRLCRAVLAGRQENKKKKKSNEKNSRAPRRYARVPCRRDQKVQRWRLRSLPRRRPGGRHRRRGGRRGRRPAPHPRTA